MWEDFFNWVEKYAGCTFDLSGDFQDIEGDAIFIDPMNWKLKVFYIISELNEMLDVLEEYKTSLTDNFPSYSSLRTFLISETLTSLIENVNSIKRKLNIEPVDISNVDNLRDHVVNLYELVHAVSTYSLEQLSKKDWFDEFEDDNDNFLKEEFGLSKDDLTNIHFVVNDIIQLHEEDDE